MPHLALVSRRRSDSKSTIPDGGRRQMIQNNMVRHREYRVVVSSRTPNRPLELLWARIEDGVLEVSGDGGWGRNGGQQLLHVLLVFLESARIQAVGRFFPPFLDRNEVDECGRNHGGPQGPVICGGSRAILSISRCLVKSTPLSFVLTNLAPSRLR